MCVVPAAVPSGEERPQPAQPSARRLERDADLAGDAAGAGTGGGAAPRAADDSRGVAPAHERFRR